MVTVFDVKNIDDFWGEKNLKVGLLQVLMHNPVKLFMRARQGEIVEIVGKERNDDPESWYNTWTNVITLLQPDGTLITYKNVIVNKSFKLKLNQKIFSGQVLGEVAPNSDGIVILIYHNILESDDLLFVIPQFVTEPGKIEMVNQSMNIKVVHPKEIRGLEMTKREQRKFLKE